MPTTWSTRILICAPVVLALVFLLRSHLMARKAEYWTLAEGTENPNDKGAVMRVLFVGNSFIHYNGGAEKVKHICRCHADVWRSSGGVPEIICALCMVS